jgi:hypothetical protein
MNLSQEGLTLTMHALRVRTKRTIATAAMLAVLAPATAGAAETYIPGVTDSSTGVLAELEKRRAAEERYLPGITDSSTGVLRELERRALERGGTADAGDAGLPGEATIVAAAIAAAVAAAGLGLAAAGRRRRVATA